MVGPEGGKAAVQTALLALGGWLAGVLAVRAAAPPLAAVAGNRTLVQSLLLALLAVVLAVAVPRAAAATTHRTVDPGYVVGEHQLAMTVLVTLAAAPVVGFAEAVDAVALGLQTDYPADALPDLRDRGVALAFVAAYGVVLPVAEERVWRGLVQPAAAAEWGSTAGVILPAAGFVGSRLALLYPTTPVTGLLVFGLVLGAVRRRYGTVASTIVNVTLTSLAAYGVVLEARWTADAALA